MPFSAVLRQRQLVFQRDGQALLTVPLDQGGRYRLVAPEPADIVAAVAAMEAVPGVVVLPADGGLLGAMTVSANLSLALCHGQEVDAAMLDEWEHKIQLAFRLCGVSDERVLALGREQPMRLERLERWLTGFVLQLLRPAEVLVLDRAFAGLSRRQAERLIAMEAVYHEFHPFRPVIFVDLDAHGLPQLPQCRQSVELESQACPS